MRALLQRVSSASVTVEGAVVGRIGQGVLALVGVGTEDTEDDMRWLVNKILNVRMFEAPVEAASGAGAGAGTSVGVGVGVGVGGASGDVSSAATSSSGAGSPPAVKYWAGSVKSLDLELLLVSQFTLHARCTKPKPDFSRAMGTSDARAMFDLFVERCRAEHKPERVQTGVFGAMMSVALVNEGPVTLWLDSHNRQDELWPAPSSQTSTPAAVAPTASASSGGKSPRPGGKSGKGAAQEGQAAAEMRKEGVGNGGAAAVASDA